MRIQLLASVVISFAFVAMGCSTQQVELLQDTPTAPLLAAMQVPTTRPALPSGVYNWNNFPVQQTNVGQRRAVDRGRTATLSDLQLHITTLNAGQPSHAAHRHDNEELIMVKEGTLEAVVNDKPIPMPTGSILFVAPNDLHMVRNVGTTPATYFVVAWRTPLTGAAQ